MADPGSTLRERSKARRRAAIQRAAMRLFAERGYDGTTIAEIAEEAELAPRTVLMYFPSKLDIAMSAVSEVASRLTVIVEATPGLVFSDLIDLWLRGEAEALDPDLAALSTAMLQANPALRAVSTARVAEAASVARQALDAEVGLPTEDPMARIVGGAIGGALGEYLPLVGTPGAVQDIHPAFMRYLRGIIAAARPASPARRQTTT